MSEEVALFGGNVDLIDPQALVNAMEETKDEGGRASGVSFLSFSGKRGAYKLGVDERVPGADEPFLLAITAFELGWMCWKGGKPVAKRMANISAPRIQAPDMDENGPFDTARGEGWARARSMTMRSMENGEQAYLSLTSKSGVAAMADMQRDVLERIKSGQPSWPVITLGVEDFEANGFKNSKPVFNVVKWLETEQVQTLADPDVDPLTLLDGGPAPAEEKPEPPVRRRL